MLGSRNFEASCGTQFKSWFPLNKKLLMLGEMIDGIATRLQPRNETFTRFGIVRRFRGIENSRAHSSNDNWNIFVHSASSSGSSKMKLRSKFKSSKFLRFLMAKNKREDSNSTLMIHFIRRHAHLSAEFLWNYPQHPNTEAESTRTKLAAKSSNDCRKCPNSSGFWGCSSELEIPRSRSTKCWCAWDFEAAWPTRGTQWDRRTSSKLAPPNPRRFGLHRTARDDRSYENCSEARSTLNFDENAKVFRGEKFSVSGFNAMKTESKLKLDEGKNLAREKNKWKQRDFHDHSSDFDLFSASLVFKNSFFIIHRLRVEASAMLCRCSLPIRRLHRL